ncbi:hypothetical protein QE152_g37393 [Popillia japonica]|uniref:Uncharacterized protein n=1 Tax=Popillia japonica TaxID=7064 RepID=A0AAW1IAT5_POPJA
MSASSLSVWKDKFVSDLLCSEDAKLSKYNILTKTQYEELLKDIVQAKLARKKTSLQYRRVNRFDVLDIGSTRRIIAKSKTDEILYYLPVEEIFDVIESAHISIGHGGRDRLRMETSIKQSPYKAMFGIEPRVGLATSSLPLEIIATLEREEDLEKIIAEGNQNNMHEDNTESDSENLSKICDKCSANLTETDINCCLNCTTEHNIKSARLEATNALIKQANKMKSVYNKTHPPANVGDNVTVPIPDVDKPKGSFRNVIAVILLKTDKKNNILCN